ncbi:type II toxin-antitoxin system RelE/ParE family toxin [Geomonas sp. Red32]|uniref:type II toxin-antitoxin system RelE/ParE family toxin n=1 Tax=Geomonas sp. Red32 TaxID=2912856 RepID=UPI00202CC4FE|nr:type II toxin-antitoxin system RelE/ParE family toxin [Geomonas sp. Red32]MCM0082393.1 type II toxin-antitoxin system RelE/ParE family toxin [Geomonas sp. Red32]
MIKTFKNSEVEALFADKRVARFVEVERTARRKLLLLNQARTIHDLRNPPGNRLEALTGDRDGQYSIRVNDKWRVCFRWDGENAFDVEIVDYH